MNRSFWQVQIIRSADFKANDTTGPIYALLLDRPASPFEKGHYSDLDGSTATEQRNVGVSSAQGMEGSEYTPGFLQTDDLEGQIAKYVLRLLAVMARVINIAPASSSISRVSAPVSVLASEAGVI